MGRLDDLDRFYALLSQLEHKSGGRRYLADATAKDGLPRRGVYFFFEPGELREDGVTPRVVRVGTHAIAEKADTTLWNRLRYHRGHIRGPHAGGGNHRASIFRRHVGSALIQRDLGDADLARQWETSPRPKDERLRAAERQLELRVSQVIRSMPFLWLAVDDPPGKESHRSVIEANAIGLLSNWGRQPVDPPSPDWLGRWAVAPEVSGSGLWNVNCVNGGYDPAFLALLDDYIGRP